MKILIADDDVASRTILTMLLEKTGHQVITADNGNDAYDILCREDHPEMAILDWLMPGKDGAEVCRAVRKDENNNPIYLIMLTIKGEKSDIIEGLESGANDYISKPYDPGELHARIKAGARIIELQRELTQKLEILEENDRRIRQLLTEKDMLLYEAHYRIRSNVNLILEMIDLQADSLSNKTAAEALKATANRMKTLGLVYEKLYHSEFLERYSAQTYIMRLVEEITRHYPDHKKVQIDIDVDQVDLDLNALVKIGMLINELTENAMRHAFSGMDTGTISIDIRKKQDAIHVDFSDNGIGLPVGISPDTANTFGFKLVNGICKNMNSSLSLHTGPGTHMCIHIPHTATSTGKKYTDKFAIGKRVR